MFLTFDWLLQVLKSASAKGLINFVSDIGKNKISINSEI